MHRKVLSLIIILILSSLISCNTLQEDEALNVAEQETPLEEVAESGEYMESAGEVMPSESDKSDEAEETVNEAPEDLIIEKPVSQRSGLKGEKKDPDITEIIQETEEELLSPEPVIEEVTEPGTQTSTVKIPLEEQKTEDPIPEAISIEEEMNLEDPVSVEVPLQLEVLPDLESEENLTNPLIPIVIDSGKNKEKADEPAVEIIVSAEPEPSLPRSEVPPQKEEVIIKDSVIEEIDENESISLALPFQEDNYILEADASGKLILLLEGSGWIFLSENGKLNVKITDKSYDPVKKRTRFVFTGDFSPELDTELVFLHQDLLLGESEQKSLVLNHENMPFQEDERLLEDTNEALAEETVNESTLIDDPVIPAQTDADQPLTTDSMIEDLKNTSNQEKRITDNSALMIENLDSLEFSELEAQELLKLAERFEAPGPSQSLEKALMLYKLITVTFPVSEERFTAESRIRYLNRHYFKLQ